MYYNKLLLLHMKEQAKLEKRFRPWVKWYKKVDCLYSDKEKQEKVNKIVQDAFNKFVTEERKSETLKNRLERVANEGAYGETPTFDILRDAMFSRVAKDHKRLLRWIMSTPMNDQKDKEVGWHAVMGAIILEHCLCSCKQIPH